MSRVSNSQIITMLENVNNNAEKPPKNFYAFLMFIIVEASKKASNDLKNLAKLMDLINDLKAQGVNVENWLKNGKNGDMSQHPNTGLAEAFLHMLEDIRKIKQLLDDNPSLKKQYPKLVDDLNGKINDFINSFNVDGKDKDHKLDFKKFLQDLEKYFNEHGDDFDKDFDKAFYDALHDDGTKDGLNIVDDNSKAYLQWKNFVAHRNDDGMAQKFDDMIGRIGDIVSYYDGDIQEMQPKSQLAMSNLTQTNQTGSNIQQTMSKSDSNKVQNDKSS